MFLGVNTSLRISGGFFPIGRLIALNDVPGG